MCWLGIQSHVIQGFLAVISRAVNSSELTAAWEEPPGKGALAGRCVTALFASDWEWVVSLIIRASQMYLPLKGWRNPRIPYLQVSRRTGFCWTMVAYFPCFWILPSLKFRNKHVSISTPSQIIVFIPDWLTAWHCATDSGGVLLLSPYTNLWGPCVGTPVTPIEKLYYHSMNAIWTQTHFFFWLQSLFPMILPHLMICIHQLLAKFFCFKTY